MLQKTHPVHERPRQETLRTVKGKDQRPDYAIITARGPTMLEKQPPFPVTKLGFLTQGENSVG